MGSLLTETGYMVRHACSLDVPVMKGYTWYSSKKDLRLFITETSVALSYSIVNAHFSVSKEIKSENNGKHLLKRQVNW